LELLETALFETATQECIAGGIYGPVKIQMAGFRAVYSEVAFVEMQP
jgi:hypothetical protein